MGKIDLKGMLTIARSGEWCSIDCITANLASKKAGRILRLKKCRIARRKSMEQNDVPITNLTGVSRNANHNANFTLNMELENGQIRKIHPVLVFNINGNRVI